MSEILTLEDPEKQAKHAAAARSMSPVIKLISLLYIASGLGATYLSFKIGLAVLNDITHDPEFAWVGVTVFEATKIFTIVLFRYSARSQNNIPGFVWLLTRVLQIGLFSFAIFCSLAFFSKYLASPNLEQVKNLEIATIETTYGALINETISRYDNEVKDLRNDLKEEMGKVVGNTFKGERYKEFERRLGQAEQKRQNELDRLYAEKATKLTEARKKDYLDDARVRNETVNSLVITVQRVLGWALQYSTVIFILSALTSFLIEGSIYVTFELVTISSYSAAADLRKQSLKLEEEIKLSEEINEKKQRLAIVKTLEEQSSDFIKSFKERFRAGS